MPQRPMKKDSAPAEIIDNLSLGYNGYTDPTLTKPQMWAQAVNVFSGAFGFVQRCRFANVISFVTPVNILQASEFNTTLANKTFGGNLSNASLAPFAAAIHVSPSVDTFFYENVALQPNTTYTFSVFVEMDDGSAPRVAQSSGNPNADLTLNIGGNLVLIANSRVSLLSGSVYRVSGFLTTPSSSFSNWSGLLSYATLSGKAYTASGYQLQLGNTLSTYQKTPITSQLSTGLPFTSLKYFALPGLSSYLLADINGKLLSFDTGANYAQTQRINPYIDPAGSGSASLNGPWSREVLQNIVYEMNGTVKQAGRLANGATIEGFGLDAPDASPAVAIQVATGLTQNITAISRSGGIVTATLASTLPVNGGNGIGLINVVGVVDTSYNGTFVLQTGAGTSTLTWNQQGPNTSDSTGSVNVQITKSVGRSYAWAWENANKPHVSAPSPSTQFIKYTLQNGTISLIEPGTISIAAGGSVVTGVGTFFTPAWIGRNLWAPGFPAGTLARIVSVSSPTSMAIVGGTGPLLVSSIFQVYDSQATHVRLYETADSGATYFRTQRNAFTPGAATIVLSGLQFFDNGNSEPPNFPFTTETSQLFNQPPPIGSFLNEYQGRLCVFGVPGALQSFFYSNVESTNIGMPQESYAPLNQVTLPIANGQLNGMLEFPGSLVIWSDKQDMFRLTGLLTDNTALTASQQGASISRLPYSLGACSPYAMDITPLGGIWVTPTAEIWLFTDRYAPRNIGRPVQDILNSIPKSQLAAVRAKYFHANNRNWFVLAVSANGSTFNNTLLVLDLDLLASNGSPSYFTFDMATNHPAWFVFQPGPLLTSGTPPVTVIVPRCDLLETVFENNGNVRLLSSATDLIQDVDYQTGNFGTEIQVPGAGFTPHAWGNEHAFVIKRPSFIRFNTNQDPSLLAAQGWSFQAQGIDDDFYTFGDPLRLNLTPGVNDTSSLCGNPSLSGGSSFRHSPELFKIGGVNFVAGRRLKFQVNFPALTGDSYQLRSIQIGFGPSPPR